MYTHAHARARALARTYILHNNNNIKEVLTLYNFRKCVWQRLIVACDNVNTVSEY